MLNSKMKSYEEIKIIVLNAVNQVLIDNELTIEKLMKIRILFLIFNFHLLWLRNSLCSFKKK
ncbi:hypothetical protein DOE63_31355 [Salmonella enterica subsp. diarizonae serovar 59:z10:-]|nr:hypothetical protein DOE63_31355 [Salmonella enterica subsp. diarizonae serovar 59:z10:-]